MGINYNRGLLEKKEVATDSCRVKPHLDERGGMLKNRVRFTSVF